MTRIGTTELDVLPLVLGGNTFGWTSGEAESFAVLDAFVDAGGGAVDTSDSYSSWAPGNTGGESETILGAWMAARRNHDTLLIGTKVSRHPEFPGLSPANIRAAANASLERLGIERIDLYYAHRDDPEVPLADTVGAFEELRVAGKIRDVAVSNYSGDRLAEWIAIAREHGWAAPVAVQPPYNLVRRRFFEKEILPAIEAEGIVALPYAGLASGFLTGKYRTAADVEGSPRADMVADFFSEDGLSVVDLLAEIAAGHDVAIATIALAWLGSRPGVAAPIASARIPGQLPDLLRYTTVRLSADEVAALDRVSATFAS